MPNAIPVFYSPKQAVPNVGSYSPSAGKPAVVAQALLDRDFPVRLVAPRPLLFAEIARVHAPRWVENVLAGKASNGFGNCDIRVARSLPYTSGSMLSAALAATPTMPAVSLSSGFHHAGYDHPSGFCTFNGLAITAAALLSQGKAQRVAILDCDAHYGDGTDAILRRFPELAGRVLHCTVGRKGVYHAAYLRQVSDFLMEISKFKPDVLLYQAGADPHESDPLGGFISTDEMAERDRMVFSFAMDFAIPVAWNLAGGYQRGGASGIDPVLALHLNTFREACKVYHLPVPAPMLVSFDKPWRHPYADFEEEAYDARPRRKRDRRQRAMQEQQAREDRQERAYQPSLWGVKRA